MSHSSEKKWIVQRAGGGKVGPYTREEVIHQIREGVLLGDEMAAVFPGGDWAPLMLFAEFRDSLLDALSAEIKLPQVGQQKNKKQNINTNVVKGGDSSLSGNQRIDEGSDSSESSDPTNSSDQHWTVTDAEVSGSYSNIDHSDPGDEARGSTPEGAHHSNHESLKVSAQEGDQGLLNGPIIELTSIRSVERKSKSFGVLPIFLILAAIVLAAVGYLWPEEQAGHAPRVHLLNPRNVSQEELPTDKIKEKYRKAIQSVQVDTFTGYSRAQNELVEILERWPKKATLPIGKGEVYGVLCLIHRELWPYAYQDSQDLRTLSHTLIEAKRFDPAGIFGATCEVLTLYLDGKLKEATTLADSILAENSRVPTLLEFRGETYFLENDYSSAISYFTRAKEIWPRWQKLAVQEAKSRAKVRQYPSAIRFYEGVLHLVPKHAVAKIQLASLEINQFRHFEKGFAQISEALQSEERVPKNIESQAYYDLAQVYQVRNDRNNSLKYARRAYSLNPGNGLAKNLIIKLGGERAAANTPFEGRELVYLGDQYVRSGDCFSAQAQFKAAFDVDKKNGVAAMKAAKCLWKLNQSKDSIDWLKKAVAADPELLEAYVEMADEYAQRFDYQSAFLALRKAQKISPKSYEVFRGFATVELYRNNFKAAADFAQKALALYSSDVETNILMARAQMGMQAFQEAQKFALRANEVDKNSLEANILLAKSEVGLRGIDAGIDYLRSLVNGIVLTKGKQIPRAAIEYRIALGEIFLQDDRAVPAQEVLNQALSLDRDNKKAYMLLGKAAQILGLSAQALENYLRAAVLDPSDAEPVFRSGEVYLGVGKYSEASSQFSRVLRINDRYPGAHVQLGRAAMLAGDSQKALEEAALERDLNPALAESYLLSAEAYYTLKQYSNCAANYQIATAKSKQNVLIYVKMARCYRLSGALDSAQSLLRQAQAQESGHPEIYKEQGAIYHTKGMANEAIAAYETYLELSPSAADRREVEARIQRVQNGDLTVGD